MGLVDEAAGSWDWWLRLPRMVLVDEDARGGPGG